MPGGSEMQIGKDTVVVFHYRLSSESGDVSESTDDGEPLAYLHGRGQLVRGLEQAMRGRTAGDTFTVELNPEQAYGAHDPAATQRVPIKHLVRPGKLAPGKVVVVNMRDGQRQATVLKVGRFNVDLDLNHPLAGKTLSFDIRIVEVREATAEELAHGHVHGPGGAHH